MTSAKLDLEESVKVVAFLLHSLDHDATRSKMQIAAAESGICYVLARVYQKESSVIQDMIHEEVKNERRSRT